MNKVYDNAKLIECVKGNCCMSTCGKENCKNITLLKALCIYECGKAFNILYKFLHRC